MVELEQSKKLSCGALVRYPTGKKISKGREDVLNGVCESIEKQFGQRVRTVFLNTDYNDDYLFHSINIQLNKQR